MPRPAGPLCGPGNGAPFSDMPEPLQRLRRGLPRNPGGDRVMAQVLAQVLAIVLTAGLDAVLVAMELALEAGPPGRVSLLSTLTTCSTLTLPGGPASSANSTTTSTATSTASSPAVNTMASTCAITRPRPGCAAALGAAAAVARACRRTARHCLGHKGALRALAPGFLCSSGM